MLWILLTSSARNRKATWRPPSSRQISPTQTQPQQLLPSAMTMASWDSSLPIPVPQLANPTSNLQVYRYKWSPFLKALRCLKACIDLQICATKYNSGVAGKPGVWALPSRNCYDVVSPTAPGVWICFPWLLAVRRSVLTCHWVLRGMCAAKTTLSPHLSDLNTIHHA